MQLSLKRRLRQKRPIIKRLLTGALVGAILLLSIAVFKIANTYKLSPSLFWNLVVGNPEDLKQHSGRTNILLLGVSGGDHAGSDLTDTLMVVSLGLTQKDIVLISLPRDIWITTLKDKVNTAYHYGEEKVKGGGLILSKSSVEEVVGIPIHYAVLVDFEGFKKMVDIVGGIDVVVTESFTDSLYPIPGKETDECQDDPEFLCRYETVSFTQGQEHMDGDRALKYVRSRYSSGVTGTDFSRGRRQQAVILALKNKVFTFDTLTNLNKVNRFMSAVNEATTTDMILGESLLIARLSLKNNRELRSVSLTQDLPESDEKGLLINPPTWQYDNKWVLIPKDDDFSQIHKYVACILEETTDCTSLLE